MFTSEPSLIQRIERMIADTPIVDIDTDLNPDRLSSPDIFAILDEPMLVAALTAVGMSAADRDVALSAEERIRKTIPYLAQIRNTAAAWCFYRILRDLFDFYDPHLTESNADGLMDRIVRSGKDETWGPSILRDRCNLRAVVTTADNRGDGATDESLSFIRAFNVDRLFEIRTGSGDQGGNYPLLRQLLTAESSSKPRVLQQVHDWLDRNLNGPPRLCRVSLLGGLRAAPSGLEETNRALKRAADPKPLSRGDVNELAGLIHHHVYGWHADHGKTLQLAIGGPTSLEGADGLASIFQHFGMTRFDLLAGCDRSRREAALLAALRPNVSVSASWRHDLSASAIADFVGREVHTVPMTKLTGFASGASSAEWIYGKFQMARKAMAAAFARLIEAGYYEEDEIPPILRQILHDTPQSLYSLGS